MGNVSGNAGILGLLQRAKRLGNQNPFRFPILYVSTMIRNGLLWLLISGVLLTALGGCARAPSSQMISHPKTLPAKKLVLKVMDGQLLGCDAREALHVMGGTEWIEHAHISSGGLLGRPTKGFTISASITLFHDQNDDNVYTMSIQFLKKIPVGVDTKEYVQKFFSGIQPKNEVATESRNFENEILDQCIYQYSVLLPEYWSVLFLKDGNRRITYTNEFGEVQLVPPR